MANIKFSQFTVGNVQSDIDFVVGYKGGDNIQISPANLLSASLSGYLPLTGGTMTGNIKYNNSIRAQFGTGGNAEIFYNGTNLLMSTFTGDMILTNYANDKDIIFQSDDGSGGTTEYFRLDGSMASSPYVYTRFPDNSVIFLGDGGDAAIFHDGTDTRIKNETGNLFISQFANDKDIIFRSDDGSGGVAEYFRLDGSLANGGTVYTRFPDLSVLSFGNAQDLRIYHSSTNSFINNVTTGDLYIQQSVDDKDIIFQCDDGAGGLTNYFALDGSIASGGTVYTVFPDNSRATFGTGFDLQVYHDASNSYIKHINSGTGDLIIQQERDDADIIFNCDNGSGGVTEYITIDGANIRTKFSKNTIHTDSIRANFGNGSDMAIHHTGGSNFIEASSGTLNIRQNADDSDIVFQCDDGFGGTTTYFYLDGSANLNRFFVTAKWEDNIRASFGAGADLDIYHDGTHSYIGNDTGNLYIQQLSNDSDIIFQSDDGSGGTAIYFMLDGSETRLSTKKDNRFDDNIKAEFGTSADLEIYHNGTNSVINNKTNNLQIINNANDGDISFQSDDGSGGTAEYFRVDGSSENVLFSKLIKLSDNVELRVGDGNDLKIYHDGSNSYIKDGGTGNLNIQGDNLLLKRADGSQTYLQALTGSSVSLYHAGNKKLETTNTGINIQSVPTYADNTAAIAGGLTTGDVYRTGDLLKIVH